MDIGWCARAERSDQVRALGYDYIEVALAPLSLEDDHAFESARKTIAASSLPTPVFNQFLPKSMMVVGPDVDRRRIQRYLTRVADVAQAGRAEVIVFGSGWARNVPPGWSLQRAGEQFLEMLRWCTDALHGTGVILALEAQNHTETNYMTTIEEAVVLAKKADHPAVRVMADIYHLYMQPETFDIVTTAAEWIVHVHLSDSERRTPGTGSYALSPLFDRLKAARYQGRMSVECMTEIPDLEMKRALEFVRAQWG